MSRYIRCERDDWCFLMEEATGFVREVMYGRARIAIAIYSAVRGVDWSTLPVVITQMQTGEAWCRWHSRVEAIPFEWTTEVAVDAEGFRMTLDGVAARTFATCRTGLCVLHPLSVCGAPVTVRHVDGSEERSAFPELVAPHQPFLEVSGLRYVAPPGVEVEITFEGEVFETEDQRNWSDASFKTYCHRLGDGRPYTIEEGQRVRQEVRIRCRAAEGQARAAAPVQASVPQWSVLLDTDSVEHVQLLQAMGVQRVAVDDAHLLAVLARARMPVDWRVRMEEFGRIPPIAPPAPDSTLWVVCDVWSDPVNDTVQRGREKWESLGWQLGYSSSSNFAELNRSRPPQGVVDWLGTPASPQVHTFDAWSILQNAESFDSIGRTMASFAGGARLCLGPLSFASRFSGEDARADSKLAAAYLLMALAHVGAGGFSRVIAGRASTMLNETSEVGSIMRDLLGIRAHRVEVSRQDDRCSLQFTGVQGQSLYMPNLTPWEHEGLRPFSARRQENP